MPTLLTPSDAIFVSPGTWAFNSPRLHLQSKRLDLGAITESLTYHEETIVALRSDAEMEELLRWTEAAQETDSLVRLIREKRLSFAYFNFDSLAIFDPKRNTHEFWNVQVEADVGRKDAFLRKVVYPAADRVLTRSRVKKRLFGAIESAFVGFGADEFGAGIQQARSDSTSPLAIKAALSALLDQIWPYYSTSQTPEVTVEVIQDSPERTSVRITPSFELLNRTVGNASFLHPGAVLTALIHSNRDLWACSKLGADIYTNNITGSILSAKLGLAISHADMTDEALALLQLEVGLPDIRLLANDGSIGWKTVVRMADESERFRHWLHSVSDGDRDILSAYHNDVHQISGVRPGIRIAIRFLGRAVGGAAGAILGIIADGSPTSILMGGAAGNVISGLIEDLATRSSDYDRQISKSIHAGWRPVIFGEWLKYNANRS